MPDMPTRARPAARRSVDRRRRARHRRHARDGARQTVRDAARRLRRGDASKPGARLPRGGAGRTRRVRHEGVPVGRRAAAFAEEGLGADVSTAGELAFALRAGLDGRGSSCTATTRRDELLRGAADAGALVVLDSLDELERAQSCRSRTLPRPRHAGDRGGHARGGEDRAPRLEVRPAARRRGRAPARASRTAKGLHVHVGSQLMHFGASLMTVDWVANSRRASARELGWTPRLVDLGGGLGVRHVLEEPSFSDRGVRRRARRRARRAWQLQQLPEPQLRTRAGTVARLPRRHHALHRRRREACERRDDVRHRRRRDVRQPAAGDVQRALRRAACVARRRRAGRRLRDRGQALRVGRRADRARGAAAAPSRRHPRGAGHRRVHARDVIDVQRSAAAGGGARRGRRGAADPPARDGRRPARARKRSRYQSAVRTRARGRGRGRARSCT